MKKRAVTLVELLIVILLIGIIGGALAFNMKGSLNEGKAFKSKEGKKMIEDILSMEAASSGGQDLPQIAANWREIVKKSPLVKGDDALRDGWGFEWEVHVKEEAFEVISPGLSSYKK